MLSRTTAYGYDNLDRVISVTLPDPTTGIAGLQSSIETYGYDLLIRLGSVSSDSDGVGGPTLPSVTSYGYDILSRLETVTDPLAKITRHAYDNAGQLLSLKDPLNNETLWAYDKLGRAVMETNAKGDSRSFEYNDAECEYEKIPEQSVARKPDWHADCATSHRRMIR